MRFGGEGDTDPNHIRDYGNTLLFIQVTPSPLLYSSGFPFLLIQCRRHLVLDIWFWTSGLTISFHSREAKDSFSSFIFWVALSNPNQCTLNFLCLFYRRLQSPGYGSFLLEHITFPSIKLASYKTNKQPILRWPNKRHLWTGLGLQTINDCPYVRVREVSSEATIVAQAGGKEGLGLHPGCEKLGELCRM